MIDLVLSGIYLDVGHHHCPIHHKFNQVKNSLLPTDPAQLFNYR